MVERNNKVYNCILLIILLVIPLTGKSGADTLLKKGNRYYSQKKYNQAINIYKKITESGYESGTLYFNLGNSYYRKGEIGKAILYYEKAQKLSPNDEDVKFNLDLARSKIENRINRPEEFFLFKWGREIMDNLPASGWALLLSISIFLASLFFAVYKLELMDGYRTRLRKVILFFIIVSLISIYPLYWNHKQEKVKNQGIILDNSVSTLAAPQSGSTRLFEITEGTKVKILQKSEEWIRIELLNGDKGWIKATSIGII